MPGSRVLPQTLEEAYRPGDLVYGLAGPRHRVLCDTPNRHATQCPEPFRSTAGRWGLVEDRPPLGWANREFLDGVPGAVPVTVDAIHDIVLGTGRNERSPSLRYAPYEPLASDSPVLARYIRELEASRYDPRAVAEPEHRDTRVKKACKFGIEYTVTHGGRIHFVLDGLLMGDESPSVWQSVCAVFGAELPAAKGVIPDKSRPRRYHGAGRRAITGSELRFIYRNRNRRAFRDGVVFWKDGMPVVPPWEALDHADLWRQYVPKHEYVDGPDGQAVRVATRLRLAVPSL